MNDFIVRLRRFVLRSRPTNRQGMHAAADIFEIDRVPNPLPPLLANKQHGFQLLGRRMRRGRLKVLYRASQFMHTGSPNREKTETCWRSLPRYFQPLSARLVAADVSGKKRPVPVDFERQFSRNQRWYRANWNGRRWKKPWKNREGRRYFSWVGNPFLILLVVIRIFFFFNQPEITDLTDAGGSDASWRRTRSVPLER